MARPRRTTADAAPRRRALANSGEVRLREQLLPDGRRLRDRSRRDSVAARGSQAYTDRAHHPLSTQRSLVERSLLRCTSRFAHQSRVCSRASSAPQEHRKMCCRDGHTDFPVSQHRRLPLDTLLDTFYVAAPERLVPKNAQPSAPITSARNTTLRLPSAGTAAGSATPSGNEPIRNDEGADPYKRKR